MIWPVLELKAQCTSTINTFPFNESFEINTAGWTTGGTNNDWAWGSPVKPSINSAGAGTKCWITGGLVASFYNYGQRSWVESPCFDFTNLSKPFISFKIYWETERNYDGGNFQYSLDAGVTWINAGSYSDDEICNDQNWFNNSHITNLGYGFLNVTHGWSGTTQSSSGSCTGGAGSGGWITASHCLPALGNKPLVKFRFTFGSGTTCNDYDGFAFDDFTISKAPSIQPDFAFTCTGDRKIKFDDLFSECHNNWQWDFGDPASPNNIATGENVEHDFSTGGSFTVTLTTSGACYSDTQIIKSVKILTGHLETLPVSCIGDADGSIEVIVDNPGGVRNYIWVHDATLNSSSAGNLIAGAYSVNVSEPGSCPANLSATVGYGPDAFPVVSLGNDTVICPGSQFSLKPGNFLSYLWQDNTSDSVYTVTGDGEYYIRVENFAGCEALDTIMIKEDCLLDILLPNSFTPNGDGVNEIFYAVGSEPSEYIMYIFNRWGEKIFTSDDIYKGWDGSYRNRKAEIGIYNYLVNYNIGGTDQEKKGMVFLLR
jgi:gliding motility-associated-like protein